MESKSAGMALKTRDKLIEVARQLFARKGVENTTMLDIANASDKGRRTIYTYFKNKREIHQAVIERESDQIVERQRQIAESKLPPLEKLHKYLEARFEIVICPTGRRELQESLQNLMRLDVNRAMKTRMLAAKKEIEILRGILDEGVTAGVFSAEQAARALPLIITVMKGGDSQGIDDLYANASSDRAEARMAIIDFIISGIMVSDTRQAASSVSSVASNVSLAANPSTLSSPLSSNPLSPK